ncbi:MAG TPA: hypothetical protein PKW42_09145, partial [bacterium]|nr:hypothetical protein [bacterium]
ARGQHVQADNAHRQTRQRRRQLARQVRRVLAPHQHQRQTDARHQQHRQNQKIKPEYDTTSLTEALGINCSYETTPLACRVDERAAQKLVDNSLQLLKKISRLLT